MTSLESLYNLRVRESDRLKTELALYNLDIHQKKAKLDNQRLKTMVKRSREQNLRSVNFDARNGRMEFGAVVKSQREQRRVTRRMLAVESHRAVFERRRLQFPTRQE